MLLRNPLALVFLAALFVPLERLFAIRRAPVLRAGWRTDVLHFFATHVLQQLTLVLGIGLAVAALDPLVSTRLQQFVSEQPHAAQLVEALLIVELVGYGMHRAFHRVPWLWRIHAVHHSSEHLDWLAALRVHPLDQALTRAVQFVPLYLLGFGAETFAGLTIVLGLWALFLHANVRVRLGPLERLVASPHFHHWHHARAEDCNFSGLFPWVDSLFGTHAPPSAPWPSDYGCDAPVPTTWWRQMKWPVTRARAAAPVPDEAR